MRLSKYTYIFSVLSVSISIFAALIYFFRFKTDSFSNRASEENSSRPFLTSASPDENSKDESCIGIWVPYLDLEINSLTNAEKEFKSKFEIIVNKAKNLSANTLIVHVRSHNDSLYPSSIFPWSHLLTGTQGRDPGFDPLKYMVKTCHDNNLKFHAWINPLRIKSTTYPKELCSSNTFFKLDSKKYFLYHKDGVCYNPAYEETRKIIIDGVKEIANNYEVDAIHFDDYFYPCSDNITSEDRAYSEYLNSSNINEKMSLEEWRKNAVNILISQVYNEIKLINPKIEFGISPPGNLKKCSETGIDINFWCEKNKPCVDYICPQIYWSTTYPLMPFEKVAKEWKEIIKSNKVKLYGGLAVYKAGSEQDSGTWKTETNILSKEVSILKDLNYSGVMLYAWKHLNESKNNQEELKYLCKRLNKGF